MKEKGDVVHHLLLLKKKILYKQQKRFESFIDMIPYLKLQLVSGSLGLEVNFEQDV